MQNICFELHFIKKLKENGYVIVLGGVSFQFRREVNLFQIVTCKSQLIAVDNRWFYFVHLLFIGNKFVGKGLAKICFISTKKKREPIQNETLLKAILGLSQEQVDSLRLNSETKGIIKTFSDHDLHLKEGANENSSQ